MHQARSANSQLAGLGTQAQIELSVQCQAAFFNIAAVALHIQQAERQCRFVYVTQQFAEERFMGLAAHAQASLGHIIAIRDGNVELASLAEQMCLHVMQHHLHRRMVEDHVMEQQDCHPALVGRIFGEDHTQQRCLAQVQPRMARVEALLQLIDDRAIGGVELDLLQMQAGLPPDDLHRCFQTLPQHCGTQDVVTVDHTLQGVYKSVQTLAISDLEERLQNVWVALFGSQMVVENPLLQRCQWVDILHITDATRHAGDNTVNGDLIEIGQRQQLRSDARAIVGIAFSGTVISLPPPTAAASAARVGWPNSTRTSALKPAWRMRSMRLTASSECPPNSKKWSCRPTCSTLSTSAQIVASRFSTSPCGAS